MEQAQTAALDAANIDAADADISSATLSEVAGVTCYKVEFTSGNHTYAYSINAESGEVLEASYRDKNAAPTDSAQTDTTASGATTTPAQTTPNINTSTGAVDEAKAQEIALAHAGVKAADATITKSKLDYDDGRQVYEIEWYANGAKYDYEIDAATGKIVSYDYDAENYTPSQSTNTNANVKISEATAKQIALSSVPGATAANIYKFKLDFDDGRWEYERWSTTSPSTPIPARSSNGTWNPSTTEQKTNQENENMNKTELIAAVAEDVGVGKKDTEQVLNAFFSTVQETLKQNDKVQIPGFGSFEVRERAARTGRNPHTGETIEIAAAKVPAFKPEKGLKDAIQ